MSRVPNSESREFTIRDFSIESLLGEGQFGQVWLATEKRSGLPVAIKSMDSSICTMNYRLMDELNLHQRCNHPNIIMYLAHFGWRNKIYLVHEYASGGNLFSLLQQQANSRFAEHQAAKYTSQTADALLHIHNLCFVHADIKPENILIDANDDVKISDFGLCFPVGLGYEREEQEGTLEYLAPEVLCDQYLDTKMDIWSLGVLVFEMLVGKSPFKAKTKAIIRRNIINVRYTVPRIVGENAMDLIQKILVRDPRRRIPLEEILKHPWIVACKLSSS